jgi:hypothetical protein
MGRIVRSQAFGFLLGLAVISLQSCTAGPAPIVIHEEPRLSVWLKFDPKTESGHSHPGGITSKQMVTILQGIWVEGRDTLTGLNLLGEREKRPAFSSLEVDHLAPYLSEALKKASPTDMATFYFVIGNPSRKWPVTSGGMFLEDGVMLHVILANCRSSPSGGQDYATAVELDTRDDPLLPLSPFRFKVGFTPQQVWIQNAKGKKSYVDPAKELVIDLQDFFANVSSLPAPSPPSR